MKNETYTVYGDISSIPVEDLKKTAYDAMLNDDIDEQTLDVATNLEVYSLETLDRVNYLVHDEHLKICANAEALKVYLLDDWGADTDPRDPILSREGIDGLAEWLGYGYGIFPVVITSKGAVQSAIDNVRV